VYSNSSNTRWAPPLFVQELKDGTDAAAPFPAKCLPLVAAAASNCGGERHTGQGGHCAALACPLVGLTVASCLSAPPLRFMPVASDSMRVTTAPTTAPSMKDGRLGAEREFIMMRGGGIVMERYQ
jgi:hypothetical protein